MCLIVDVHWNTRQSFLTQDRSSFVNRERALSKDSFQMFDRVTVIGCLVIDVAFSDATFSIRENEVSGAKG